MKLVITLSPDDKNTAEGFKPSENKNNKNKNKITAQVTICFLNNWSFVDFFFFIEIPPKGSPETVKGPIYLS